MISFGSMVKSSCLFPTPEGVLPQAYLAIFGPILGVIKPHLGNKRIRTIPRCCDLIYRNLGNPGIDKNNPHK